MTSSLQAPIPRRCLAAASVALALVLLPACGSDEDPPAPAATKAPVARFVDAEGRRAPALSRDARVVDLGFLSLDLLDVGANVVAGYSDGIRTTLADGVEPALRPRIAKLRPALSESFEVQVEALLALDPDVVLTTESYAGAFAAAVAQLRKAIPVVVLPDALDWRGRSETLGRLLGREPEARAAVARTDAAIAAGRQALTAAGRAGDSASVLRVGLSEVGGNLEAYVPPSFPSQIVRALGLVQPAAQQRPSAPKQPGSVSRIGVSTERLADHDADTIVDLEVAGATDPGEVTRSPLWKRLSAVRAGRVVQAPYLVWTVPSTVSMRVGVEDLTAGPAA